MKVKFDALLGKLREEDTSSAGTGCLWEEDGNDVILKIDGIEVIRIDKNGNVGIKGRIYSI